MRGRQLFREESGDRRVVFTMKVFPRSLDDGAGRAGQRDGHA
jgi:hypothetical protein